MILTHARERLLVSTCGAVLGVFLASSAWSLAAVNNQALVAAAKQAVQARVFNVRDFGAAGDGTAMDTAAVQKAIDACHRAGGGVVRVPGGDYQIGTIRLKSNVTLSLDHGATLLGSTRLADYPTAGLDDPREGGPHCLIYAKDASNITIEGLGVIDGRGTPEYFPRRRSRGCSPGDFGGLTGSAVVRRQVRSGGQQVKAAR